MSFNAGAIVGSINLDISGLTSAIAESAAKASLFPHIISEFMEHPLLMLTEIAHEAADAIKELVLGVTESQHELANTAQAIGVSVEFLDGWSKAAKLAGANGEELTQSLVHLSRAAVEATRDSAGDAAKAFRTLGVQVREAGGGMRPLEELARDVSDALHEMEGGVNRNALAQDLFSRAGYSTLAFLNKGSDEIDKYVGRLRQMGAITTREAAEQATAFEDMIQEVKAGWEGIKLQLAAPIRDALKPMLENLLSWMHTHPEEIRQIVQNVADTIVKAIHDLGGAAVWVKDHFNELIKIMGAVGLGIAAIAAVNAINSIGSALKLLIPTIEAATVAQTAFNAVKWGGAGAAIGAATNPNHPAQGAIGGLIGGLLGSFVPGPLKLLTVPLLSYLGGYAATHQDPLSRAMGVPDPNKVVIGSITVNDNLKTSSLGKLIGEAVDKHAAAQQYRERHQKRVDSGVTGDDF
jgi:TP901 family phage tail tape measure protein